MVGNGDVKAEELVSGADGADRVEFENVGIVVTAEAWVFEQAAEEAGGFDRVADVLLEQSGQGVAR